MDWQSPRHLATHFRDHGREVGAATVEAYDASARAIIAADDTITFSYEDETTFERRVGVYQPTTGLLTIMSDDDRWIISHMRCDSIYVNDLMRRDD